MKVMKRSPRKTPIQHFLDWAGPVGLFILYFTLYNYGKFSASEMVKTSGLVAISLLSLTLVIGPLARFVSIFDALKVHRKFWGIASFLFLLLHISLVVAYYYHFNFLPIIDPNNKKFSGLFTGILGTVVLLLITLTSNQKALQGLGPKVWKAIQTFSYVALILAIAHFYLMEQVNGVLVIKRLLGRITFWFAAVVLLVRLVILFLPKKQKPH